MLKGCRVESLNICLLFFCLSVDFCCSCYCCSCWLVFFLLSFASLSIRGSLVTIRKHRKFNWNRPFFFVSHCLDVRLLLSRFVVSSSRHCVGDSSRAHLMCRVGIDCRGPQERESITQQESSWIPGHLEGQISRNLEKEMAWGKIRCCMRKWDWWRLQVYQAQEWSCDQMCWTPNWTTKSEK
jgi:hypothetical protein